MNPASDFIWADWPAPAGIRAGTTRRTGGVSKSPFDALNLGDHVGDASESVALNRGRLQQTLALPAAPIWLNQVHGTTVARLDASTVWPVEADAAVTRDPACVLAILTADCLPVVLTSRDGQVRAAAHAGWRGLAAGVLEATVAAMDCSPGEIMAWLGPAIGPRRFEVGAEVRAAFVDAHSDDHAAFREARRPGKFLADIYALARARLQRAGISQVSGGGHCTVSDAGFYSHRGDRGQTGRMATLIWYAPSV